MATKKHKQTRKKIKQIPQPGRAGSVCLFFRVCLCFFVAILASSERVRYAGSEGDNAMTMPTDVLCAGIIVADHVSSPIAHLPKAGELVLADQLLLTIGGCAANVAVDLVKLGVAASVVGRVGGDVFGRVVADMLRERGVGVETLRVTPGVDTSQTLIVNVAGQDRRFIHTFGANAGFRADDIPRDAAARCKVLYLGGYLLM